MFFMKKADRVQTQAATELPQIDMDQLRHVSGAGLVLSESIVRRAGLVLSEGVVRPNGLVLSE